MGPVGTHGPEDKKPMLCVLLSFDCFHALRDWASSACDHDRVFDDMAKRVRLMFPNSEPLVIERTGKRHRFIISKFALQGFSKRPKVGNQGKLPFCGERGEQQLDNTLTPGFLRWRGGARC